MPSKTIRVDSATTAKGYDLEWFSDVFSRYMPPTPDSTVTPSQLNENEDLRADPTLTALSDVTVGKAEKPNENGQRYGVTVEKGDTGQGEVDGHEPGPDLGLEPSQETGEL